MIDSQLTSEISDGISGGTIDLDPQFIVLQRKTVISTAAMGNSADGGQIFLGEAGDALFIEPSVDLNVSSQAGQSGTVQIDAVIQQLSETVVPISETFLATTTLYAARCIAQKDGVFSSFTSVDRDGLPSPPGNFLLSPLFSLLPSRKKESHRAIPFMTEDIFAQFSIHEPVAPNIPQQQGVALWPDECTLVSALNNSHQ